MANVVFLAILNGFIYASGRRCPIVDAIHCPGRAQATTPADPGFGRSFVLY
jgi:hypothetical protein